jgi:hypothetical protein
VGGALINLEMRVLDLPGRKQRRSADRNDLVVVAMDDEGRNVEPLQVLGKVGLREGLDAVEDGAETGQHPLEPERVAKALRDLGARPVGTVEWFAQILEELRAVGQDAGADTIEHVDRQAAGVGLRLEHNRRYRADQHCLGDTFRTVTADIAGNFAAARGMTDMDRVLQVERSDERARSSA